MKKEEIVSKFTNQEEMDDGFLELIININNRKRKILYPYVHICVKNLNIFRTKT